MINLFSFVHALKLSWIKRIIYKDDLQWLMLLKDTYGELNSLCCKGGGVRKSFEDITEKYNFKPNILDYCRNKIRGFVIYNPR